MTSNSRRSSWTTQWPKDRPLHSTLCPQEEGVLRSSCCLCVHHNRNLHVLRRPLPLLPPPPTMAAKARVRSMGRRKARPMATVALATTLGAPWHGRPSTIPGPATSQCGQGCTFHSSSRCIHYSMPCLLHWCTTMPPAVPPSCPCQHLHCTSSGP
jgi:hypothetical protein